MIKCMACKKHQQNGRQHTCQLCSNKIVYGDLQEPIQEFCNGYEITDVEKRRRAYYEKIYNLPIEEYTRAK